MRRQLRGLRTGDGDTSGSVLGALADEAVQLIESKEQHILNSRPNNSVYS